MLKALGVIFISSAIAATGFLYSSALKKRTEMLSAMCRFVEKAETQIRYVGNDIFGIISSAAEDEAYKELPFLGEMLRRREDWGKNAIEETVCVPNKTDAKLIKSFFEGLGQSDCEGQISHCSAYKDFFRAAVKKAMTEQENKGRLSRSLALFAATGLAIILI